MLKSPAASVTRLPVIKGPSLSTSAASEVKRHISRMESSARSATLARQKSDSGLVTMNAESQPEKEQSGASGSPAANSSLRSHRGKKQFMGHSFLLDPAPRINIAVSNIDGENPLDAALAKPRAAAPPRSPGGSRRASTLSSRSVREAFRASRALEHPHPQGLLAPPSRRPSRRPSQFIPNSSSSQPKPPTPSEGPPLGLARSSSRGPDDLDIHHLMELQQAFVNADTSGDVSLDMDEFLSAFASVFGPDMTTQQLETLFMKIDANSDGTIDWDEFCTFVLLENQGALDVVAPGAQVNTYTEQSFPDPNPPNNYHRGMIDRLLHIPKFDRYYSTSRDGTVRVWSNNLVHQRTIRNGAAWITDAAYLGGESRLAVASVDRAIRMYEMPSYEPAYSIRDLENAPMALDALSVGPTSILLVGDDAGYISSFRNPQAYAEAQRRLNPEANKTAWEAVQPAKLKMHSDWITRVAYIPDLTSIVSCSLDKTIRITDLERMKIERTLTGHKKGIHSFAWSPEYKMIASCGLDRTIRLWNPFISKTLVTLTGHTSPVTEVIVNDADHQLISLSSSDKTIKIWDLRKYACVQTIVDKSIHRPENRISALVHDPARDWLVSGTSHLHVWPLERAPSTEFAASHDAPVSQVLYNHTFDQICSSDDQSRTCTWDVRSGKKSFTFFSDITSCPKVTAMGYDYPNARRLITGYHDGTIKVWNFNNGQCLGTLIPDQAVEITDVLYITESTFRYIVAVGWNGLVNVFIDHPSRSSKIFRSLQGHTEDVLAAASSEGHEFVTGDCAGKILVWNFGANSVRHVLFHPPSNEDEDDCAVEKLVFVRPHIVMSLGAKIAFWHTTTGMALAVVDPNHARGEHVVAYAASDDKTSLWTGDSKGYVRGWKVDLEQLEEAAATATNQFGHLAPVASGERDGISYNDVKAMTSNSSELIPVLVKHTVMVETSRWRAHEAALTSMTYVPVSEHRARGAVVTASQDAIIRFWSETGRYLSRLGRVDAENAARMGPDLDSADWLVESVAIDDPEYVALSWNNADFPTSDELAKYKLRRSRSQNDALTATVGGLLTPGSLPRERSNSLILAKSPTFPDLDRAASPPTSGSWKNSGSLLKRSESGSLTLPKTQAHATWLHSAFRSYRLKTHDLSPLTYTPRPPTDRARGRHHFTPPPYPRGFQGHGSLDSTQESIDSTGDARIRMGGALRTVRAVGASRRRGKVRRVRNARYPDLSRGLMINGPEGNHLTGMSVSRGAADTIGGMVALRSAGTAATTSSPADGSKSLVERFGLENAKLTHASVYRGTISAIEEAGKALTMLPRSN